MAATKPYATTTPYFGLALSGGGFRASFFHLGVLRRLAELDLLRFVTTISTVSGGSLIGAHYYLLFKEKFEEKSGKLETSDYVKLVEDLEEDFIRGNRADFRNRLFCDAFAHFRAFALGRSYGRPMARLYAKHLYGPVTWRLYRNERYVKEGVPLHRAIVRTRKEAPETEAAPAPVDSPSSGYPGLQVAGRTLSEINAVDDDRALIPRLVINATCLNTGGPFLFAMNEIGGPTVGYIRSDEVFLLVQYKTLIARVRTSEFLPEDYEAGVEEAIAAGAALEKDPALEKLPKTAFREAAAESFPRHTLDHLRFFLAAVERIAGDDRPVRDGRWFPSKTGSAAIRKLARIEAWEEVRRLMECDYGALRRAKVAAWHLLDNIAFPMRSQSDLAGLRARFVEAVSQISPQMVIRLGLSRRSDTDVLSLVLDLYYLRSAENIDWTAPQELADLTLSQAVAASANFPPVFTPFRFFGLYSASRYDVVALTDGGINDNQGIGAVTSDGCRWIVASDAGGLVGALPDPPDARIPMMDRIINVLMGGLRDIQLRLMRDGNAAMTTSPAALPGRGGGSVHFHIGDPLRHEEGEVPRDLVAHIRTDLDAFNEIEQRALIRRGYLLTGQYVPGVFLESGRSPFPVRPLRRHLRSVPANVKLDERTRRILRGSAKRVGKLSEAYPVLSAAMTGVLVILFAVMATYQYWGLPGWLGKLYARFVIPKLTAVTSVIESVRAVRWIEDVWWTIVALLQEQSVIALAGSSWIAYLAFRGLFRVFHANRRAWRRTRAFDFPFSRISSFLSLAPRVMNIVTCIFLFLFLAHWEPQFLFGVLPLWCFPIALFFLIVVGLYTPLWLAAGSLSPLWPFRSRASGKP